MNYKKLLLCSSFIFLSSFFFASDYENEEFPIIPGISEMLKRTFISNLKNTDHELKNSKIVYANPKDSEEKKREAKKNNLIFQAYEKARENSEIALKRNEIPEQEYYVYTIKKEDLEGGNGFNKLVASLDQRHGTLATVNGISSTTDLKEGMTLLLPVVQGIYVAENPTSDFEFLIKQEYTKEIEKAELELKNQKKESQKSQVTKSTEKKANTQKVVQKVVIENKEYKFVPGKNISQTAKAFQESQKSQNKDDKMILPLLRKRVTSPFGYRTSPVSGTWKLHAGIDLGAPVGTDVFACSGGTVTESSFNSIYGNFIIIRHKDRKTSTYAHLSKSLVTKGQIVKKGDKIGEVGMTGATTGPHLHWEIRENGSPSDPAKYVK